MKKLIDDIIKHLDSYVDEKGVLKISPMYLIDSECIIILEDSEGRRWSSGAIIDTSNDKFIIKTTSHIDNNFKEWLNGSIVEFLHSCKSNYCDLLGPFRGEVGKMNKETFMIPNKVKKNTVSGEMEDTMSENIVLDEESSIPTAPVAIYRTLKGLRTRVMNSIDMAIEKERPSCKISLDYRLSGIMSKELEILGYKVVTSYPDDNGNVLMEIIWFED